MGDEELTIELLASNFSFYQFQYIKKLDGYVSRKKKGRYIVNVAEKAIVFSGKKNSFLDGKYKALPVFKNGKMIHCYIFIEGKQFKFDVGELKSNVKIWAPDWFNANGPEHLCHTQMAERLQEKKFKENR